ncbi:type 4 pilus major pilin [Caedibacter taeniospiralis]|uniref:type 4 pilus major pilin n=1 Tax=Caedibacter taeniospiralis TaxID=28907 RepID=UPI001302E98D|nr:type 4 pilus major pilin [Caedibacter taeniospiralis]
MNIVETNTQTVLGQKNSYQQQGYSLLELMIVLAVIAGLVAIAVFTAQALWSSSNSAKLFQGLSNLDQNINMTYGSDYSRVTIENLIKIKAIPKELGVSTDNKNILTPWGGTISIDTATGKYSFSIPASACPKTVPLFFGNVVTFEINKTAAPATLNEAMTSCSATPNLAVSFI